MPQPEHLILVGAALWAGAALATSLPKERFDSGFPLTFASVAFIGGIIGITESVPETLDMWLTGLAAVLFFVTPICIVAYLYWHSDSTGGRNRNNGHKS